MEKPPSMHFRVHELHNPTATSMEHRFPPYKDQTDGETQLIRGRGIASPSSDNAEADHFRTFQYYQDRDIDHRMRQQSEHAFLGSARGCGDDSPSTPFSANLLTPSPAFIQDDSQSLTSLPQQYSVVPPHGTRNGSFPDSRNDVSRDEQQPNFDILQPNQRGGKRGPFTDPTLREQTAQTRKMGSCIRCRMQRIRCEHNSEEPNGPCMTCKKVVSTKASRFPCLRYKITDVRLYKPGQAKGFEWTRRWDNNVSDSIQKWASSEIKIIRLSEGYSDQTLQCRVRRFVPQPGDKLTRSWSYNGEKKEVELPPYALVSIDEGRFAYEKHIERSLNQTCTALCAKEPGGLLYKTYMQMLKLCKIQGATDDEKHARSLLQETFKLWMSVRLTTKSVFIVGEETLGISSLDETSPTPGQVPIPCVMGAQLDLILIHQIQSKLRRSVLEKLEKMVSKRKHNTWMVTYLVTFVLLHNTSLITAHDASYALKHHMDRRFAREDKVREYHLGANILLAHFHYCNKGVHPFSDECKDQDLRTLAGLNEDQIQFIHATRSYVRRHKKEWERIRAGGSYEHDYFFVSQLFEEQWQPLHTI